MIPKKVCFIEKIVPIKRSKEYSNKEQFVQLVDLLHVSFCHPKEGSC